MSELYKCNICKQVHADGGNCYNDKIYYISDLEGKIFKSLDIIDEIIDQHCDSDSLRKLLKKVQKALEL
jgi:hypothetical protein